MSTEPTRLGPTVHNSPHNTSGAVGEAIGGVGPLERARTMLDDYSNFTDAWSMLMRKRAATLGFQVEGKTLPARAPLHSPIRIYVLKRQESPVFHQWVIEANMDSFLEGWAAAVQHVRDVPYAGWYEAP
jgi:hypothetical protein